MFGALFLAFAASLAPPPAGPPPPLVVTVDSKADWRTGHYRQDAFALANQLSPATSFAVMMEAQLELGLRQGMGEDLAELEKDMPGLVDELVAEVRSSVRPLLPALHRDLLERSARIYSASLSSADTAALGAFYSSPAGLKLVATKYAHMSKELPGPLSDPDRSTSAADIVAFNRTVAGDVVAGLSADERKAFEDFMKQPAFRSMMLAAPRLAALDAVMANEENPAVAAAIHAAIGRVMERRGLGD